MTGSEIEDALYAHEPPIEPRFIDAALVECERNPRLYGCDPSSVVAAVAISERLDLPVDCRRGAAFLTVEREGQRAEALYLPGYPAFDICIRRDPEVLYTASAVVHDRDDFRFAETSTARELVPGAPRLSRFLVGVAALAGAQLPEDGFRHVRFSGSEPGPVVAIYAEAHYRNGAVKRELMRRRDFEGKAAETTMDSEASEARNWGNSDGLEKLRGLAIKRLAKGLERTVEMGVLIYLARGAEKARYRPRSIDAALSFGIRVEERRPAPGEARAIAPVVPPPPILKVRCCSCGNDDRPTARSKVFALHQHMADCGVSPLPGSTHDLCDTCFEGHRKALAEAEKKPKKIKADGSEAARAAEPKATAADVKPLLSIDTSAAVDSQVEVKESSCEPSSTTTAPEPVREQTGADLLKPAVKPW